MGRMLGMTTQERMEDISRKSGLSIDICRRVLNAEADSIVESLRKGERAALAGRVTLRPEFRQKLDVGCNLRNVIKIKAEVSSALESRLADLEEFEKDENEVEEVGIRARRLDGLF